MHATGVAALQALADQPPGLVQEHMLMIAMLGAHGRSDPAEAVRIEREMGPAVPIGRSSPYGVARAYLLAWADKEGAL